MSLEIDYSGGVFSAPQAQKVGTITAGYGPYAIGSTAYTSKSLNVVSGISQLAGEQFTAVWIKPDGSKLYVLSSTSTNSRIHQWSLSTAFDISTGTLDSSTTITAGGHANRSMFFKSDGTRLYLGSDADNVIYQHDLSTAWDLSTLSYSNVNAAWATSNSNGQPYGLTFKPDGTKFYVADPVYNYVHQRALSTAWDLSTAGSVIQQTMASTTSSYGTRSVAFNDDGTQMFATTTSSGPAKIYTWSLTSAYAVNSASQTSTYFDMQNEVGTGSNAINDVHFSNSGNIMYVLDNSPLTLYQYEVGEDTSIDLSKGNYFNFTPSSDTSFKITNPPASGTAAGFTLKLTGGNAGASYDIANASYDNKRVVVSTQVGVGAGGLFFKPDGSNVYVISYANDVIHQFTLSVNWDISTATNSGKSVSVVTQENSPRDLYFTSDGYSVFIVGNQNKTVFKYTLSTAWDISTASYANVSFSVSSQSDFPRGVTFKTDGTEMYISDDTNDAVDQYSLSTAFDITTASYTGTTGSISTGGFFYLASARFKPDGTGFFVTNNGGDDVDEHSLSTPWDVTTSSYVRSFYANAQTTVPQGLAFSADGTKMYVMDTQTIYQYSVGSVSPATITYPSSVKFASGTAPVSPAVDETDVLVFYTDDGGTTYQGFKAGDAMA